MAKCTGHNRAGQPCKNNALTGRATCASHGGKTPRGKASPHFRHGRHSKYLPERLVERVADAAADPELLSLRAEIALTDGRMTELLERLSTGESQELWITLLRTMKSLRHAEKAANRAETDEEREKWVRDREQAIDAIETCILEAIGDERAWGEIDGQAERRRKLVETENRREAQLLQHISAAQALTMLATAGAVIERYVTDPVALAGIEREFRGLALVQPGRPALGRHPG